MKLILLLLVLCFTNVYSALVPKNLAGEPSEFKSFNLPSPLDVSQSSDSLLLSIVLEASETTNDIEWVGTVPVDSDDEFTLSLFSSFPLSEFNVVAIPPTTSSSAHSFHGGRKFIKTSTPTTQNGTFGIDGATTQSLSYTWTKPTIGDWTVKITASSLLKKDSKFLSTLSDDNSTPQLMVLAQNPSDIHIYSYISSYNNLFVGEKVSVLAMLHKKSEFFDKEERPLNWKPEAIKLVDASALIKLSLPDGSMETIEMFDDGLHDDLEAGDGLFGGYVSVAELGNYEAQVILKGVQGEKNVIRSNQHLIPITTQFLVLTGEVQSSQDGDANLNINFIVESGNGSAVSTTTPVRLYSEVYGTDKAGNKVAIAWVGGVVSATPLSSDSTQFALTAQLNARWIAKVSAVAPFFVKNVLISDLSTFVPLSNTSSISTVEMIGEYKDVNTIDHNPPLHVITKEMRDGKMPQHLAERYGKQTGNGKLILVHGYCAEDDPFTFEDFENAVEFQDFNQNRPNDEFAQKIAELGEQYTDGYSLVVHSQGGNAALHLLTFYHSGLDLSQAFEGRVVQSMGTPYQGTALAGTWASIGKVVGIGCSKNNDLTVDGAALWLNSIPADKRSLVYYTTTQYSTGSLINSCNLAANAVLKFPNDGVVDLKHSGLEGGNNLDHIKGWCHTTDMNSPPQTQNHEYNKIMSEKSVW